MDYKKIGKKIEEAMRAAGHKRQIDAAKILGMTQPNLSKIYRGIVGIENRIIEKAARVTKQDISYFLGDEFARSTSQHSLREVSIPVFTSISESFPSYDESDVKGYLKFPHHMYEEVKFVLKNPTNIAEEPDDKGDYYYFKIEKKPRYGKTMLLKVAGKFHIARITTESETVKIHYVLSGKSFTAKSSDVEYIGTLLGIYREIV